MGIPSVTIHIAESGTDLKDPETGAVIDKSSVGHMWYTLNDGNGNITSYGFAPAKHGQAIGTGKVYKSDDKVYANTAYSKTIPITPEQYEKMKDFGNNPTKYGFNADKYNGLNNSCIDYTWKGLEVGDLNPSKFEGHKPSAKKAV